MGIVKSFYCCLLFLFVIGFYFSCGSKKIKSEEVYTDVREIPDIDQILNKGIQMLPDWVSHWENKGLDFEKHNLVLVQDISYETLEWPEKNVLSEESPLKAFQIPHPENLGYIDIYDYKIFVEEDHKANFNPDSEVVYFKNNGMRERLLFIGPSGIFEDACWIGPSHLMVTGHFQKELDFVPIIWLITPDENRYYYFEYDFSTPNYDSESYLQEKIKELDFGHEDG